MTEIISQVVFILYLLHACQSLGNTTEKPDKVHDSTSSSWKTSRKFKGLVLENGLKVILISDPHAVVAAGSLHIAAGSMNNPPQVQCLAHLLEHMLFNGNEKYQEPEAFSKYVSENGGDENALTNQDNTEYKFSVLPTALPGALDRLFHMIYSPLLLDSSVRDEITVVNSEHVKNVPQDNYRLLQIKRSTSQQGHPFNNFATGSHETLWTKPHQLGINVTQELRKFHETYYSSNLMTLAVLGNNSFTELEEMVTGIFSKLKNRNTTLPSWSEIPYGPSELGVKIEIIPKGGLQYLSLEFPILDEDLSVFNNYYSKLISSGGKNSLLEFLKSADLVSSLTAEITTGYREFNTFSIAIYLTDFGVRHHERVVMHVFEFINFLRNSPPKEWFWDEVKRIKDIAERFRERDSATTLVYILSKFMIEYSPGDTISAYTGNYTRLKFNATRVANVLNYITPENLRLYFVSNTVTNTTSFEPNYQIDYSMRPLDPTFKQSLKMAVPNPSVQFPTRNGYLPKNFTIKRLPVYNTNIPKSIHTEFSRLWFLQDSYYLVPRVDIGVKIFNPVAYSTPLDTGLNVILGHVLNEALGPVTTSASAAGTVAGISGVVSGLNVAVVGYNDGIERIVYKVMETITSISFTNESFHVAKELYLKTILHTLEMFSPAPWPTGIFCITLEDLELFYRKFISRLRMEWLIYGNVLEEEAIQMVQSSEEFFVKRGSHPSSSAEYKWQSRNVQIPRGTNWLYKMTTTSPSSTCTRVAFQTPKPDLADLVKITLLADLMAQPAYVELRSKEQLGYVVAVNSDRELGYSSHTLEIFVQGERDPTFVEGRINKVLLLFRDTLRNMTEEEFDERKVVQWTKWDVRSGVMEGHFLTFWREIYHGHYNFHRDYYKLEILDGVKLDELQAFYDELIGFGNGGQRRLSIHVTPANYSNILATKSPFTEPTSVMDIMNSEVSSDTTTFQPLDEETTTPNFLHILNETEQNAFKTFYYLKDFNVSSSSINDNVNNNLDVPNLNERSLQREGKTLKQLKVDFLNQTAVEIIDFVGWKRGQYLYSTPGMR